MSDEAYIKRLEAENILLKEWAKDWKEKDKRRYSMTYIVYRYFEHRVRTNQNYPKLTPDNLANIKRNFKEEIEKAKAVSKDVVDLMIRDDKYFFEDLVTEVIGYD